MRGPRNRRKCLLRPIMGSCCTRYHLLPTEFSAWTYQGRHITDNELIIRRDWCLRHAHTPRIVHSRSSMTVPPWIPFGAVSTNSPVHVALHRAFTRVDSLLRPQMRVLCSTVCATLRIPQIKDASEV